MIFEQIEHVNKSCNYIFVWLVCFGLYLDMLSVSMRSSVIFCIDEHTSDYIFVFLNIVKTIF